MAGILLAFGLLAGMVSSQASLEEHFGVTRHDGCRGDGGCFLAADLIVCDPLSVKLIALKRVVTAAQIASVEGCEIWESGTPIHVFVSEETELLQVVKTPVFLAMLFDYAFGGEGSPEPSSRVRLEWLSNLRVPFVNESWPLKLLEFSE